LRVLWDYSESADVVAPVLEEALKRSGATRIVDLCSGSSGSMISVQRKLAAAGLDIPVLVTDKFPDPQAMAELERRTGGAIKGSSTPVDATCVPEATTGFRTIWNAFHHFPPGQAREILRDAQASRQPIAVFEFTERILPKVLLCYPASFFSVYLVIFKMRPRRVAWWVLTWILPVIPLTIAWDGFTSHLRSYTQAELLGLVDGFSNHSYSWQTGRLRAPRGGLDVTFLVGSPTGNTFDNIPRS
jgi:hypothetical protein